MLQLNINWAVPTAAEQSISRIFRVGFFFHNQVCLRMHNFLNYNFLIFIWLFFVVCLFYCHCRGMRDKYLGT